MSKIYEALLRAELERAVANGEPVNQSAIAVQDLLSPQEDFSQATDHSEALDPFSEELPSEAAFRESYMASPDLSQVVLRSWSPDFGALPALEERGGGVEQFRSLRSHITEFRDQRPLKTILVSSGLPGEGKSFVALNLALSFARHKGSRVLLIDGDMRRSSLHRLLGAPQEPGLTEYLSGEAGVVDVMQRAKPSASLPLPPGLASLTFVAGGRDADKAGDLATNHRFAELVAAVSPAFDWIVVDSSPVNLVSDAANLAHAADGVLLVCREGVTKFKTIQQAHQQFKNATVLGVVLNAVKRLPKADYYGSYESYRAEA